jgi:hypothetical protein
MATASFPVAFGSTARRPSLRKARAKKTKIKSDNEKLKSPAFSEVMAQIA